MDNILDENIRKLIQRQRVAELAVSRVTEKLNVLLIQEPGALVGVKEDVQWIQKELMPPWVIDDYDLRKEIIDGAYDFEDVIDDLVLRAAAKQRSRGNWGTCFLSIRIHKKLQMMKYKIPYRPPAKIQACSSGVPKYLEETEWSPTLSTPSQNLGINKAVIFPLQEKLSALLHQKLKALHRNTKKRVRRVLDELELLGSSVEGLELVEYSGDEALMVWMEKLSDVSLSAMVVTEEFIKKNAQLVNRSWMVTSFGDMVYTSKLDKEMDRLYDKIQELSISRPRTKDSQTRSEPAILKESDNLTSFNGDHQEPDFASFADDVHAMTTRLLSTDKSFRVIPIMGMEGIGKTTLAKLIFNNKAVAHHFPSRAIYGCSTRPDDSLGILWDISRHLMSKEMIIKTRILFSYKIADVMQKLKAFIIDNRSLIVMYDPSRFHYWDDLLEVLADTSNGSRMVWITRESRIPPNPKTSYDPHLLRLRADEESWALFTYALKVSIPSELQELKEKILRTCGGLPRLIVKLAEALSQKDTTIEEWSAALEQLRHDREKVWANSVCRIYKDLSLSMRRCLFSLTLFPHDFDIPTRRVITLWVAEDLMQTDEGENNEAPEDVAERCLNVLIAQGMVQVGKKKLNGNVKTVRLPDALTQYWSSKAQQYSTTLGDHTYTRSELFPGNDVMIRRLVDHLDRSDITFDHIHGGRKTSSTTLTRHYRDVLSFRSFDSRRRIKPEEEVRKFLKRCISRSCFLLLLVLDLENVHEPKLPEAVGELTQLRYLGLRSTFLEKLPSSITKLGNLQTLDIKHTHISTLPNSIWELQQLQHLYLSEGYRSKLKPRPRIGCLTTLHTLCGLFVDEETPVRDGLNRLLNLRKLGLAMQSSQRELAMSSQAEAVTEWVLNLKHLRSLRIKSIGEDYEAWDRDIELKPLTGHLNLSYIYLFGRLRNNPSMNVSQIFPISLIDLTLSGSELIEDPMQSLDKLPNLRSLKLYAKSYVGTSMNCSRGGFPELRVLKLWKLDQLEEWKVEEGALQALRELEIRYSKRPPLVPEELLWRSPFLKIDIVELAL